MEGEGELILEVGLEERLLGRLGMFGLWELPPAVKMENLVSRAFLAVQLPVKSGSWRIVSTLIRLDELNIYR